MAEGRWKDQNTLMGNDRMLAVSSQKLLVLQWPPMS